MRKITKWSIAACFLFVFLAVIFMAMAFVYKDIRGKLMTVSIIEWAVGLFLLFYGNESAKKDLEAEDDAKKDHKI